jgi:hypothetical protein
MLQAVSDSTILPAIQGTKNLSADLITLNSASQTFVNSQLPYQCYAGCQKLFRLFFAGVAQSQLASIYHYCCGCQKLFCLSFSH